MSQSKSSSKAHQIQMMLEGQVQLANEGCQFSQRNTELNAERFVQTVVLGWLRQGDASLNELAETASELGITVTGAAIHERIGEAAIELLGRVLVGTLRQMASMSRIPWVVFERFSAIHVTDSTQVALPKSLLDEFQGSNREAKMKLQVTMDYLSGQWVGLEMASGKSADVSSALVLRQAIKDSLNLFDLGYFKQEHLRDIHEQGAFFVSRYQAQTALYNTQSHEPFDLVHWLQSLTVDSSEQMVALGFRTHLKVRLVVRRLPQAIADKRRRKAIQRYQHDGKTCSKNYRFLLGWDILITNLFDADWTIDQIFALYPIRTQIEWLFRIWKSQLRIDHFGNWRRERVLCQLYAHLIGALLCQHLWAGWLWVNGREFSLSRCVQLIQARLSDVLHCIAHHWWGLNAWLHRLEDTFHLFGHKTKRKKAPSTLQSLILVGLS